MRKYQQQNREHVTDTATAKHHACQLVDYLSHKRTAQHKPEHADVTHDVGKVVDKSVSRIETCHCLAEYAFAVQSRKDNCNRQRTEAHIQRNCGRRVGQLKRKVRFIADHVQRGVEYRKDKRDKHNHPREVYKPGRQRLFMLYFDSHSARNACRDVHHAEHKAYRHHYHRVLRRVGYQRIPPREYVLQRKTEETAEHRADDNRRHTANAEQLQHRADGRFLLDCKMRKQTCGDKQQSVTDIGNHKTENNEVEETHHGVGVYFVVVGRRVVVGYKLKLFHNAVVAAQCGRKFRFADVVGVGFHTIGNGGNRGQHLVLAVGRVVRFKHKRA